MTIRYGAAYYPEQWPQERWEIDARLMVEAGLNVVRIGEFAWCRMEPAEGQYNWDWLDRVLELFAAHGIGVILCTPTASPPMWLVHHYPQVLPRDANGWQRPAGGRRHYCYNQPDYHRAAARIAEALSLRYGRHPAVVGWQIDNEFGQENTGRCYCSCCADKFRIWLRDKYGSLDQLNARWGTVFWGQEYTTWDQVMQPVEPVSPDVPKQQPIFHQNPAWLLDYERFCSDSIVAFQQCQLDAMRPPTTQPISHNTTGLLTNKVDYYDLASNLDCVGLDLYPDMAGEDFTIASLSYAYTRALKNRPFWVEELACGGGHTVWSGQGVAQPEPGVIRLLAWQAFASGAETVCHFQWRTFPRGAEQLDPAVLDLDGIPRRRYREITDVALEVRGLESRLSDTEVQTDVAILWAYDHHWALGIKPVGQEFTYWRAVHELYASLRRIDVGVDVVGYEADWRRYRVIIAPTPVLMRSDWAERLTQYVADGGTLLVTCLAGLKDCDNAAFTEVPLPGLLDELCGVQVLETGMVDARNGQRIELNIDGQCTQVSPRVWLDVLEPHGAETLGILRGQPGEGQAVFTRHTYNQGWAYYLGAWLEEEAWLPILQELLARGQVAPPPFEVPDGVEYIRRCGNTSEMFILINWRRKGCTLLLKQEYFDVFLNQPMSGTLSIPPRGIAVLTRLPLDSQDDVHQEQFVKNA